MIVNLVSSYLIDPQQKTKDKNSENWWSRKIHAKDLFAKPRLHKSTQIKAPLEDKDRPTDKDGQTQETLKTRMATPT